MTYAFISTYDTISVLSVCLDNSGIDVRLTRTTVYDQFNFDVLQDNMCECVLAAVGDIAIRT